MTRVYFATLGELYELTVIFPFFLYIFFLKTMMGCENYYLIPVLTIIKQDRSQRFALFSIFNQVDRLCRNSYFTSNKTLSSRSVYADEFCNYFSDLSQSSLI